MRPSILSLSKRAGDANVGQTLLRLARLAETAHQFETAQHLAQCDRGQLPRLPINDLDPKQDESPAHKEVGR